MRDHEDFELKHQPAQNVAKRCLLITVLERCYANSPNWLPDWVNRQGIRQYMTPEELHFFDNGIPGSREANILSWRAEALATLLWALNHIPKLPPLNTRVNLRNYPIISQAV